MGLFPQIFSAKVTSSRHWTLKDIQNIFHDYIEN